MHSLQTASSLYYPSYTYAAINGLWTLMLVGAEWNSYTQQFPPVINTRRISYRYHGHVLQNIYSQAMSYLNNRTVYHD